MIVARELNMDKWQPQLIAAHNFVRNAIGLQNNSKYILYHAVAVSVGHQTFDACSGEHFDGATPCRFCEHLDKVSR